MDTTVVFVIVDRHKYDSRFLFRDFNYWYKFMAFESIKEQIKEFSKLIEKYPHIKELYIGRAILYTKSKQYKKALEDYEKTHANYLEKDILSICERNGLVKEAEKYYTTVINANKNDVKNYIRRAYFYKRIGENKKAFSDCKRALEISPYNETILMLTEILTEKLKSV